MKVISRFIAELHRRHVTKVSATYIVLAWLLIQVADIVFPAFLLPESSNRIVVIVALAGFPAVVILAWIFDLTALGIVRTSDITAAPNTSLPPAAGSEIASIRVLDFDVLSNDPEDKYLAQGVCVETYSALAKLPGVRLVPKGSVTKPELDAQYQLSGSLRRQGENIRINVSLEDILAGRNLWSETYRRVLDDIMRVEEEIAAAIVGSFGGEQLRDQVTKASEGDTKNPTAWSLVHKARSFVLNYDAKTLNQAEAFARKALKLDAKYAAAHATLANVLSERISSGLCNNPDDSLKQAVEAIESANKLTSDDPFVLKLAGNVWKLAGRHDDAVRSLRRAVEISAFDLGAWGYLGGALATSDDETQLKEAHEILDRILEMAPQHPGEGFWLHHKALAYTSAGDFERAIEYAKKSVDKQPGLAWAWYLLANAQAACDDVAGAEASLNSAKATNTDLSASKFADFVRRTSASTVASERRLGGLTALGQQTVSGVRPDNSL